MPNSYHDITVEPVGRGWKKQYHAKCSCGTVMQDTKTERLAQETGEIHQKTEIERVKIQQAVRQMAQNQSQNIGSPVTAKKQTVSDAMAVEQLRKWAIDLGVQGKDLLAEATRTLEDEDNALSQTELEYWMQRKGASETFVEISEHVTDILGA